MIYLDHAATTPMRPGVWEAMGRFGGDVYGNSSGVHEVSRRAKNALEEARSGSPPPSAPGHGRSCSPREGPSPTTSHSREPR